MVFLSKFLFVYGLIKRTDIVFRIKRECFKGYTDHVIEKR